MLSPCWVLPPWGTTALHRVAALPSVRLEAVRKHKILADWPNSWSGEEFGCSARCNQAPHSKADSWCGCRSPSSLAEARGWIREHSRCSCAGHSLHGRRVGSHDVSVLAFVPLSSLPTNALPFLRPRALTLQSSLEGLSNLEDILHSLSGLN